jgi:chemotaxis protein CheC
MRPESLGELHLDALRETANIGAGHAATALSDLSGRRVMVDVPDVAIRPIDEVSDLLGDPTQPVAAVIVRVSGDLNGRVLQIFEGRAAVTLVRLLRGGAEPEFPAGFGSLEQSAMKEIGNVLVGTYLSALSALTGLTATMTIPAFALDMAGAILVAGYVDPGVEEDYVISIATRLGVDGSEDLRAHFLLIPDEASLKRILKALRVE